MNRIVRNVVARVLMEFSTPEALKKYLGEHPGADKSKHTVGDRPSNDHRDEDQPGWGDNPTSLADKKQHRQVAQRMTQTQKTLDTITRLKSQYDRLGSYRHNDPQKAHEVAAQIIGQRATLLHDTGNTIDHAAQIAHKMEKAENLSPQEKNWASFLEESLGRLETQRRQVADLTKNKGLKDVTPYLVDDVVRESQKLVDMATHTNAILRNILK